ncbi:hypothetical protein ACVDG8_005805 [Mesorhizobium sp. ORM8.1]
MTRMNAAPGRRRAGCKEFGAEAPLYAALKAEKAIEQKDFSRCARWKRVLEILDDKPAARLGGVSR